MLSAVLLTSSKCFATALLSAGLGLMSCGQADPPATVVTTQRPVRQRPVAPAAPRPVPPKTSCTLINDTLAGQPFGAEPTVEELRSAGATVVGRRPVANVHVAGQTDTILTLRHEGNVFEFYRVPDKDLLRQAVVTNFKPAYGRRLRLTATESVRQNGGPCGQLSIRDTDRANNVSVTFTGGQPSRARVQPYLD